VSEQTSLPDPTLMFADGASSREATHLEREAVSRLSAIPTPISAPMHPVSGVAEASRMTDMGGQTKLVSLALSSAWPLSNTLA
jgi:hypothetical protein